MRQSEATVSVRLPAWALCESMLVGEEGRQADILQRPDGSRANEWSGRRMESIPQLSTAYVLMSLQNVCK